MKVENPPNQSKITTNTKFTAIFRDFSPRPDLRAYHTSEMPIVFGNLGNVTEAIPLSEYVQGAWVAFARDPNNGLAEYGWPVYDPKTPSLVQLGGFYNLTGATFTKGEILDSTCNATDTLNAAFEKLSALL
jgi:hypothetical protein